MLRASMIFETSLRRSAGIDLRDAAFGELPWSKSPLSAIFPVHLSRLGLRSAGDPCETASSERCVSENCVSGAEVFMEEHTMPSVYPLAIAIIALVMTSTKAMAQIPVGTMRRAAPSTKVDPQRGGEEESHAEKQQNPSPDERLDEPPIDDQHDRSNASAEENGDASDADAPGRSQSDPVPAEKGDGRPKPTVRLRPCVLDHLAPTPWQQLRQPIQSRLTPMYSILQSMLSPVETSPAVRPPIANEPIAFRELIPGKSTVAELDAKWGKPVHDQTKLGTGERTYELRPLSKFL